LQSTPKNSHGPAFACDDDIATPRSRGGRRR
jgi:hypothetical protein